MGAAQSASRKFKRATSAAGRTFTSARRHSLEREARRRAPAEQDFGLSSLYKPLRLLGRGAVGEVWECEDLASGRTVAVKCMKRPLHQELEASTLREFTIQAEVGPYHENIIEVYDAVLTPTHLCLVMECAGGGCLTSHVAARAGKAAGDSLVLSEDEARYLFKQFLSAVKYCHTRGVVHFDLKLDNTLLDNSLPPIVKLCDFGFAKQLGTGEERLRRISSPKRGTPVYMSPEALKRTKGRASYDGHRVDVWACGILLHVVLLGCFPYDHTQHPDPNTPQAMLEVWVQQVTQQWSASPEVAKRVEQLSPECRDLLSRIFVVDEKERIDIEGIEEHPWFCQPLPPRFQAQIGRLQQVHAKIEARQQSFRRDEEALRERNEALAALVAAATKPTPPGTPASLRLVGLQEASILVPIDGGAAASEGPLNGSIAAAMGEREAGGAQGSTAELTAAVLAMSEAGPDLSSSVEAAAPVEATLNSQSKTVAATGATAVSAAALAGAVLSSLSSQEE